MQNSQPATSSQNNGNNTTTEQRQDPNVRTQTDPMPMSAPRRRYLVDGYVDDEHRQHAAGPRRPQLIPLSSPREAARGAAFFMGAAVVARPRRTSDGSEIAALPCQRRERCLKLLERFQRARRASHTPIATSAMPGHGESGQRLPEQRPGDQCGRRRVR